MIQLIGPGGAGKSTVGVSLANKLHLPFIDLDAAFMQRVGDISECIDEQGYEAYAKQNVSTCLECVSESAGSGVLALSSGFVTYPVDIHPKYESIRSEILGSRSTFVLLPSLDRETCVAETVRRQMGRPFARSPQREEEVIRERYPFYVALPCRKIETMRPVDEVVEAIVRELANAVGGREVMSSS